MKVEEAKTKVCPFSINIDSPVRGGGGNTLFCSMAGALCVADYCMAWVWTDDRSDNGAGLVCGEGYCKRLGND